MTSLMLGLEPLDLPQGNEAPACLSPDRQHLARLRIGLTYLWRHGALPHLDMPHTFTQLVQHRKLHDRSPRHSVLMNKLAAKAIVRDQLGAQWTVPTLWSGMQLPQTSPFPFPAMLKASHGCNQYRPLASQPTASQWRKLVRLSKRWTAQAYGYWLDEWAYKDVPRGLLAEPLLGDGNTLPVDYKIYVFGGVATHIQVHLGRAGEHRWILHDRDWRALVPGPEAPPRPSSLPAMLAAAETLAAGEDFLRVDFYEVAGQPLFGEFCLYPGSGLDRFAAPWIDDELGALWRSASQRTTTAEACIAGHAK